MNKAFFEIPFRCPHCDEYLHYEAGFKEGNGSKSVGAYWDSTQDEVIECESCGNPFKINMQMEINVEVEIYL